MTTVSDPAPISSADLTDVSNCEACGVPLEARTYRGGRQHRFCSEACRSAARRASERPQMPSGMSADWGRPGGTLEGGAGLVLAGDPVGEGLDPNPDLEPVADSLGSTQSLILLSEEIAGQSTCVSEGFASCQLASPGAVPAGVARRSARYKLRAVLRQITEMERCRRCGRDILGGVVMIKIKDGVAHFANIESCGRVWLCAVCSAKIRARRGDEIAEAIGRHLHAGGGAYFATATLPHDHGDALAVTLDVLTKSWRALLCTKPAMTEKRRYGVLGNIKAVEITHGRNGWHPHIHAVIPTHNWVDLGIGEMATWFARLDARWSRALVRHGWTPGKLGYRFTLLPVTHSPGGLAAYVTKVQERSLGYELASADLKLGRKSSRTPLQILADFGTWGDVVDLELWLEYERATQRKNAIRWSQGLRKILLPDVEEQTDDQIAAEDVGGDEFAALLPHTWYRIVEIPGADAAILHAIERDGMEGLIRTLVAYRLDTDGVLTPDQWTN